MINFKNSLRKASRIIKDNCEEAADSSLDIVNLNARVKATASMINRIHQGHDFGIVIGLDIETALYRTIPELKINTLIQPLRETFIFKGTGINVINGKAFMQHIQDTGHAEYPFGITSLPAVSERQKVEIQKQLTKIFDRVNAVYDLIKSESSYSNDNPGDYLKFIDGMSFMHKTSSEDKVTE